VTKNKVKLRQPLIIGMPHFEAFRAYGKPPENLEECRRGVTQTENIFKRLKESRVGRTVFVEGGEREYKKEVFMADEYTAERPYEQIVKSAKNKGWRVVYLDSLAEIPLGDFMEEIALFGTREQRFFYNLNAREGVWAQFLLKNAKPQDIVIVHPAHVRGLLSKTSWKGKGVVFMARPPPEAMKRRLNSRRRRALLRTTEREKYPDEVTEDLLQRLRSNKPQRTMKK
jgi:hypothetical protein